MTAPLHRDRCVNCGEPSERHFWTHPQLPPLTAESEDAYIERFSEFAYINEGREIRGLE